MFEYTKEDLEDISHKENFVRDTLEKVIRLTKILDFINEDSDTKGRLVLKGGTAINLAIFKLPRLSVDIDLDFSGNYTREEMFLQRKQITAKLQKYFHSEDYFISPKSKERHYASRKKIVQLKLRFYSYGK